MCNPFPTGFVCERINLDKFAVFEYCLGNNSYNCICILAERAGIFRFFARIVVPDAVSFQTISLTVAALRHMPGQRKMYCVFIMPPDLAPYRPYLERFDLSETEQRALIEAVEMIMECLADRAFGLDSFKADHLQTNKNIVANAVKELDLNHDPNDPE